MKTFLIILFFSSSVFANWFPAGKQDAKTVYTKQAKCEQVEGQACFDITGKDIRYYDGADVVKDDMSKPIYKPKYNLKACDSSDHCAEEMAKEAADYCQNGDTLGVEKNKIMPGFSYFCYGITGYEQKTVKELVLNSAKKAQVDSEDAAKAAEQQAYENLAKDASFGSKMIGMVGLRLRSKDLNRAQTKQVMRDYAELIDLLRVGSIVHSKAEVESITPDGTLISQADKDALLAEINAYLGQ